MSTENLCGTHHCLINGRCYDFDGRYSSTAQPLCWEVKVFPAGHVFGISSVASSSDVLTLLSGPLSTVGELPPDQVRVLVGKAIDDWVSR